MQALAQRVSSAKICINNKTHASIKEGILAYVCFEAGDEEEVVDKFLSKIINFSFFKGDNNIMSTSLKEIDGELMIVAAQAASANSAGVFGSDMDIHSVNAGPVTFSFKM